MVHEYSHTTPAVKGILSFATFSERKHMLKTIKRKIALVAVAAIGASGLALVAAPSASAAASSSVDLVGDLITRTGTSGADGTFALQVNVAAGSLENADNDTVVLTLTRNGVTLAAPPAGITWTWAAANTRDAALDVDATEAATSAYSADITSANLADNAELATFSVAKTAAPGKYVVSATVGTTTAVSNTFYISSAPASMAWTDTTKTVDASGTTTHTLSVLDASLNPTYLLAGEVADISLTAVTGATMPTIDTPVLDSGTRPRTSISTTVTVSAGSGVTAGTYTLKAVASTGMTVATANTLVVASAAPQTATTVTITDATNLNANGDGDGTLDETADNVSDAAGRAAYLSTAAKTITFKAATAATSGNIRFSVVAAGSGLPAGIAASTGTDVAITGNATDGYSASLTLTALAPAPGFGFTVATAAAGGTARGFTVTYQSPTAWKVATTDALLDGGTISVVKASTNSMTVKVTDQFGIVLPGAGVIFSTTARNASNGGAVTDAAGLATYSWKDASTSTTVLSDVVTATVATTQPTGATANDGTASTTVGYVDSVDVGTVTLTGTTDAVDANLDYETAIATDGTTSLTLKTNDSALVANTAATEPTDQARIKAVVKSAGGVLMPGVKVTFTAGQGTFFASSANATATLVPTVTSALTTLDVYTDNAGEAYAQVRVTKTSGLSVSATSGGKSQTAPVTALAVNAAADARIISTEAATGVAGQGTLVKFTVKDGFGNAVAGVGVTFSVTGNGTFLNGTNTTTGVTDTTGVASVSFMGSAAGTATVVGIVTTNPSQAFSEAAAVTSLGFLKGVKSASSTVTVAAAGSVVSATDTAITAVKTDVATANAAVKALATQVTVLQASVATLIDSLTTQIASLMKSVSALTKAVAKLQAKK
jgi:hypothetical protein